MVDWNRMRDEILETSTVTSDSMQRVVIVNNLAIIAKALCEIGEQMERQG